jgi:hypothetical protein
MGKSTPSAPAAPDPYATASAQGTANANTATAQAALNNVNTYTPYGQKTYDQTGTQTIVNPDGTTTSVPTWSSHEALSAQQQELLDQNEDISSALNSTALQAIGNIGETLANPLTADQFGQIQTDVGGTPTLQNSYASGQLQTGYDQGGAIKTGYDTGPALQYGYNPGGSIQSDVSLAMANTNAPTTFGQTKNAVQYFNPTDASATRDQATQAVLQRLMPSMAAQQESLSANLANQGTAQGSAAWQAAQLSQAQANNDLRLGAVATGDAEQQALFGQQATSNQLFNAAQNQDYTQQQGRGLFAQAGIAQNNAAIGQNNTATLNMGNFHNAAQQQQNTQNANAAGFYNQTVGQQNAQNAALAAFNNAAQGQQNAENAASAGFYNSAIGQQAQMNAAQAAFGNQSANQDYQNRLAGGAFNNSAVNQQLQQAMALQNQQINQISALRSGNQVTGVTAPAYQPATLDQTPISADVYQTAALQNQQYMAQLQNSAANTAAFGSAIGGIFGGLGKKSDRRLKSDVTRIATARNGLGIYRYRLATEAAGWHIGFMADEVALIHPEAVWTDPVDGWARVDYERAVA